MPASPREGGWSIPEPVTARGRGARALRALGARPGGLAALALVALLVSLPGVLLQPVTDRDEARFAQASRQMLESVTLPRELLRSPAHDGGLAIPMLQDQPRLNKPPLIYWAQCASVWALSGGDVLADEIWMYRVPSLVGFVGTVLVGSWVGRRMHGRMAGVLVGLVLAVSPLLAWEAAQARADMVLTLTTTVAMAAMWKLVGTSAERSVEGSVFGWRSAWVVVLWLSVAAGVLTKGPITPMVVVLATGALAITERSWRVVWAIRPLTGMVIVALTCAPWLVAVVARVGLDQYVELVLAETLGRSARAMEGHIGPPGYHALLHPALMWPGSLVTFLGVWWLWRRTRPVASARGRCAPGDVRGRFLLAWIVPSWLVLEVVATKLPHYPMPLYPAVAILSMRALLAIGGGSLGSMGRPVMVALAIAWFGVGLVLAGAPAGLTLAAVYANDQPPGLAVQLLIVGIAVACGGGVVVGYRLWRSGQAVGTLVACAVVMAMSLIGVRLAAPAAMDLSSRLAHRLAVMDAGRGLPVASVGFHEDSLVFLTRGRAQRIGERALAAWVEQHPRCLVVGPHPSLTERLSEIGAVEDMGTPHASLRGSAMWLQGLNYSKGRVERLMVEEVRSGIAAGETP